MNALRERLLEVLGGFPDLNHPQFGPCCPVFFDLTSRLGPTRGLLLSMLLHEWLIESSKEDSVEAISFQDAKYVEARAFKSLQKIGLITLLPNNMIKVHEDRVIKLFPRRKK
jgi:hypothetical protein